MNDQFEPERKRLAGEVLKMMKHPDWVKLFLPNGKIERFITVAGADETLERAIGKFVEHGRGSVLVIEGDPGSLCILELLEAQEPDDSALAVSESMLVKHFSAQAASWQGVQSVVFKDVRWDVRVVDNGRAVLI